MKFRWRGKPKLFGFDEVFYLKQYPDLADLGIAPQEHYLTEGWRQGRDPCANFSTNGYLAENPDVAAAGINPLVHFLEHGISEGRQGWSKSPTESTLLDANNEEHIFEHFIALCCTEKPAVVCEVGTFQAIPGRSTHSYRLFPEVKRTDYVMVDLRVGPDVDVVADIQQLPDVWTGRFNAFIAIAVFEHLERPWIGAKEVARVLAPGGLCFVGTHQTFPLHGYPNDFYRFSKNALTSIFKDAGLEILKVGYEDRCMVIPPRRILPIREVEKWNQEFPSYCAVSLIGRKPA